MKYFTAIILVTIVAWPVWASESYDIEVIKQPKQQWHFKRLTAYGSAEGTRVGGRLTAANRFGLPSGHVDIAVYSPSGKLITEMTTDYTPSILTHTMRKKGGLRFSAYLTKKLPPNSVVKVAFHRNDPHLKSSPSHKSNIAL